MTGARGNVKRGKTSNAKGSTHRESKDGERIRIDQQLLPGIPDDITIAKISPNFSWPSLNNLTGVSYGWLRSIQSRQVYEARKACGREQTAFVFRVDGRVHGNGSKDPHLAVYSVEDWSVCYLPQIPIFTATTIIRSFTYTSLNGKLYVIASFGKCPGELLEGPSSSTSRRMAWRKCTYVYDLAGHIGWRRLSDPKFVSRPDQSAVMNGKIFACCKTFATYNSSGFAIYDPDDDVWLPFTSGYQFEVSSGLQKSLSLCFWRVPMCFYDSQWLKNSGVDNGITPCFLSESSFDFFGPLDYSLQSIKSSKEATVVVMNGRFLKMTQHGLDVYDSHTNTWTPLHFESPESNSNAVKNLTAGGLRYSLHTGKNPAYSKRTLDVAVVKNVVYSLEELWLVANNCIEQTRRIHLYRREAVARDSHEGMPLREKYALALPKLVNLKGSCKCDQILKCPVQL